MCKNSFFFFYNKPLTPQYNMLISILMNNYIFLKKMVTSQSCLVEGAKALCAL